MKSVVHFFSFVLSLSVLSSGASKPHVIAFGKAQIVRSYAGMKEENAFDLKIRPLYVDSRLKEYTVGPAHEVTDRLFSIRRAFRLNDSLPDEPNVPRWRWQRGGWLLVDRVTGRVSPMNLPDFDPSYSAAAWYRDYMAYCGLADDGKKIFAMVVQLGRRKPVLKRLLGEVMADNSGTSEFRTPLWQRQPTRVSFTPPQGDTLTFSIRGHTVDLVSTDEEEDASE